VENPISAAAHFGPRGTTGRILFNLSRTDSPIFGSTRLNRTEEFAFFSQHLYVQIDSTDFPTGEIRGQAEVAYDYYAYLSGTHNVPPRSTAATGCAAFRLDQDQHELHYSIHHTVTDPLEANLMVGFEGQNGFLDRHFRRATSPIIGDSALMDDDEEIHFLEEQMYIEITSQEYPHGELRGQILRINPCDPDQFSTLTAPAESVVSASPLSVSPIAALAPISPVAPVSPLSPISLTPTTYNDPYETNSISLTPTTYNDPYQTNSVSLTPTTYNDPYETNSISLTPTTFNDPYQTNSVGSLTPTTYNDPYEPNSISLTPTTYNDPYQTASTSISPTTHNDQYETNSISLTPTTYNDPYETGSN